MAIRHRLGMGRIVPALVLAAGLLAAGGPAGAQSILILRPLENAATEVDRPDVAFDVEVSAFSPIRSLKINGQAQPVRPNTYVATRSPLVLRPGENRIVVEATTEFETARKEFIVILKVPEAAPPPPAKKAFQLITVVGAQNQDNVLKAPDGVKKTAGTRSFLVAIPRYDWWLRDESALRFQAIVSRDKYDKEELQGEEAAFTQGTAAWLQKFGSEGTWQAGVGYNSIFQEYESLAQGKTRLEDDTLFFGTLRQGFEGSLAYDLGLELKQQNLAEDAPDKNYEEDANVVTFKASIENGFWGLLGKLKLQRRQTDAIGKYKDNTQNQLGAEVTWPWKDLVVTGILRGRQTTYAQKDPAVGKALTTQFNAFTLNGTYKLTSWWLISLEGESDQQTANIKAQEYSNRGVTLSLIFIF